MCASQAWESDEAIEEDMPESPVDKHDKDKEHREAKKARGLCGPERTQNPPRTAVVVVDQLSCLSPPAAMKPSTSMDSSDNKKTRHKLKKFLTRRPTLQSVRDKGYIKGSIKGLSRRPPSIPLQRLTSSRLCVCLRPGVRLQPGGPVPAGELHGSRLRQAVHGARGEQQWVLGRRCRFLMLLQVPAAANQPSAPPAPTGLCVDGLYRVSGNLAVIQKLRYAVDHGEFSQVRPSRSLSSRLTQALLPVQMRRSTSRTGSGRTST